MKGVVCKYCGGNHFTKTAEGYECDYCHAVYETDSVPEIKEPRSTKKNVIIIALASIFILVFASSFFILHSNEKIATKTSPSITTKAGNSNSAYSVSQLKNPERNVRIAELTLNQEEIKLAKVSAKEYGGEDREAFERRIANAQKEHDSLKKKRPKTAPKADMIIENPNSEFAVTTYYREAGFLAAYGPEFDQYSSADILRIWGQPDEIITDTEQIGENLAIKSEEKGDVVSYETKVLREQCQQGKMTWREVRAFIALNIDNRYAAYTKEFVYEKQGKPNVYFKEDRVGYVTPIVRYVSFTRLPEKYPRAGLGKFPDDFPENYGSDGLYHEK